jgi:hypothetical protein
MEEKRLIKRYPIQLSAKYLEEGKKEWKDCSIIDINNEGMRIKVSPHEKIHLSATLQLEIVFPTKEKPIKATCTLIWIREIKEKTTFEGGVELSEMVVCGAKIVKIDSEDIRTLLEIEEIIDGLECSKDFLCYRSGFNSLCKTEDNGIESVLVCSEEEPQKCNFSHSSEYRFFCKCPLRIYIAKELKK